MVQDLFAAQDVHMNTPTMLKGKTQLEPKEVVKDRRVASKCVYIETHRVGQKVQNLERRTPVKQTYTRV
jgi:hypothetical protein